MKNFKNASSKIDTSKKYLIADAIKLLKEISFTKFDPTVELSIILNVNPKLADQMIRDSILLPHGIGKSRKVLALTQNVKAAKDADADFVGGKEMLEKIKNENWYDFDVIVATPDMMPEIGKYGKILGPKGVMPNLKDGTINPDIAKAVTEIKKGKLSYRVDKDANLNTILGKLSFADDKLIDNFQIFIDNLNKNRPSTVKGNLIKEVYLTATMLPSIKISIK